MNKYFVHVSTDISGTDYYEVIEEKTKEEAERTAYSMAVENFKNFEYLFEDEQNDEDIEFVLDEHLEYDVEEYNAEKHDGYL